MTWLWHLPDHVQHSIIAAAFMVLIGIPWWLLGLDLPAVVGALVGIAIFYGREIRDTEIHNESTPYPGMDNWRVLLPWRWHYRDSLTDFLWPLVSNGLLAAAIELGRAYV